MNRPDTRPAYRWPARNAACMSVLIATACASNHAGNPPPKMMFTVVNNTTSTVTITECHGQVRHCLGRPAHLPPKGRLSSPLSSKGAAPNVLVITGSAGQARCFVVPTKPGRVKVTQATATACPDRAS